MCLLPDLSAVSQASVHSRIISFIGLSLWINIPVTKNIDLFLMYLYSNNGVNVMYPFTDHCLKAKWFTLVLSIYKKTCNSNYVGNKMLLESYERTELKSGSGKSCGVLWGFFPSQKVF